MSVGDSRRGGPGFQGEASFQGEARAVELSGAAGGRGAACAASTHARH